MQVDQQVRGGSLRWASVNAANVIYAEMTVFLWVLLLHDH